MTRNGIGSISRKQEKAGVIGKRVTCLYPVEAYYSSYGGLPACWFRPGYIAKVVAVVPKVRILRYGPQEDKRKDFLVCDFEHEGHKWRVGLNWCNATVVI